MSDAVAIALITGSIGLAGNAITWLVARSNTRLEMRRLREPERQNRQGTYHSFVALMQERDDVLQGVAPLKNDWFEEWHQRYRFLATGVALFGSDEVRQAMKSHADVMDKVMRTFEQQPRSDGLKRRAEVAYSAYEEELRLTVERLLNAMRSDIRD